MSHEDELLAQLQGVEAALYALRTNYNDGMIDIGRYTRLIERYETRKARIQQKLYGLTHSRNPSSRSAAGLLLKKDNPFITAPASGNKFYGRESKLDTILHHGPPITRLLGMRGIGETSILYKICEREIGLYFDFSGIDGRVDAFRDCTFNGLQKCQKYGWSSGARDKTDPFAAIREAARLIARSGDRLFLLFDEAECLVEFDDKDFLRRIEALLMGDGLMKIVIATAKNLSVVNERIHNKAGFFIPLPPWCCVSGLDDKATSALICQRASSSTLEVPPRIIQDIKHHTNNQPQLIQALCHYLWSRNEDPEAWQIDNLALYPGDSLIARFEADFAYLSPLERQIVRAVFYRQPLPSGVPEARFNLFLNSLTDLGYLRWVRGAPERQSLIELRQKLTEHFDKDELRILCFDLGVDYQDLSDRKKTMAMELVAHLERLGHIPELVKILRKRRPDISWSRIPGATAKVQPTLQGALPERLQIGNTFFNNWLRAVSKNLNWAASHSQQPSDQAAEELYKNRAAR